MAQEMNTDIQDFIGYIAENLPNGCNGIKCYQCDLGAQNAIYKHLCEAMKTLAGRR